MHFIALRLATHSQLKQIKSIHICFSARKENFEFIVAIYACDEDFELLNANVDRLYCSNREWIGDHPACVPSQSVDCKFCSYNCDEYFHVDHYKIIYLRMMSYGDKCEHNRSVTPSEIIFYPVPQLIGSIAIKFPRKFYL